MIINGNIYTKKKQDAINTVLFIISFSDILLITFKCLFLYMRKRRINDTQRIYILISILKRQCKVPYIYIPSDVLTKKQQVEFECPRQESRSKALYIKK